MNLMILNTYYIKLAQFCECIQLPTNNNSRSNDYYNRQSKIKMEKLFMKSELFLQGQINYVCAK